MVNAFALRNGSIYVNTGLIGALQNEAQLASVLGHEITHVTDRHTYLLNRSIRRKTVAMEVIAAAASAVPVGAMYGAAIIFASQISQVFVVSTIYGYSQNLERDADSSGYRRLVQANYDGAAMAQALRLLDERLEFEPTEPFWRTHPKLKERIAAAEKLAQPVGEAHPRAASESDYLAHLAPVIRYNASLDLDSRRARTAVARALRLVDGQPPSAENETLLADASEPGCENNGSR